MAGKDMPSLEVRAGRGGRPPLSSRDRELGRDGSSGAILCLSASRANGRRFFGAAAAFSPPAVPDSVRRQGSANGQTGWRRHIWRVAGFGCSGYKQ